MKVLFVGATGVVGSQVVPILKNQFDLSLAAFGGGKVAEMEVAHLDLTSWESTLGALQNSQFDTVVNCAIANHRGVDWTDDAAIRAYYERCIDINARGSFHLFEAAALCKIERCVYISSLTAVMGAPRYEFVERDAPPRPRDLYSVSKLFGEQLGETYAYREKNALRVACLRLGQPYPSFTDSDENWAQSAFSRAIMVHTDDVASAINGALRSDRQFGVYPIVSQADSSWLDTSRCAEIGYHPAWNFSAQGLEKIAS